MLLILLDFILVPNVVCFSVPFTELHKHAYTVLLLMWYECVLFNLSCYKVYILLFYQVLCMSVFPVVNHINVHIPTVLCCGAKRVLFTNMISKY